MPNVYWADEPKQTFEDLPPRHRREIDRLLDLIRRFPEMYPERYEGAYAGQRRFVVLGRYIVYYRVLPDTKDCFVTAIEPARAQPR